MAQQTVECVANFSEGRRSNVIEAITAAISSVAGVHVLDVQSDADHNRSVITFVGEPGPVGEAAFRAAAKAAELIDMDLHEGEHPRIGATDVVPFVPISGVTMAECVTLARQVGRRIAEELDIPVYLYEEAATRPERRNLADIRKGEYEGLKAEIETNPARLPDFGPARLGKAGATVVGARPPLIAYNVYLNTSDVEVARRVGKAIRHLSGGLRHVKAMGVLVEGRAQVSMNMVNYRGTPLHRAFELIRAEAARYGAVPTESEIVGLVPQDALLDAAEHYLQLNRFRRDQILERRLLELTASAPEAEEEPLAAALPGWIPADTLRAFAAGTPVPGGGSASAIAGALAASLGQMVANLTIGRKRYADVEAEMREHLDQLELLGAELARLAAEDSRAYEAVMAANKLPKETEEQQAAREAAIQEATSKAAQVPLAVAERAVEVLRMLRPIAERGNRNAQSDAKVGALLAHAAVYGASFNVEVNLDGLSDEQLRESLRRRVAELRSQARELLEALVGEL